MAMLQSPTTALVGLALDAAAMRHLALADNIANADSPNHAPQRVNFEQQLARVRQALEGGRAVEHADLAGVAPFVEQGVPRGAGTTAMLDQEMVRIAQNTLHYQALLRASSRYGTILAGAINDGRR